MGSAEQRYADSMAAFEFNIKEEEEKKKNHVYFMNVSSVDSSVNTHTRFPAEVEHTASVVTTAAAARLHFASRMN